MLKKKKKMNRHLMLTQKIVHHTIGIQTTEYKEIIYGFNRNVTGVPLPVPLRLPE